MKTKTSVAQSKLLAGLVTLVILCSALLPRVLPFPPTFLTYDEITVGYWVGNMSRAFLSGDWPRTANNAYPAVTLMWLETLELKLMPEHPDLTKMLAEMDPVIFPSLPRQRLTLALLNTFIVLTIVGLLRRFYDNFVVVIVAVLMAFDPFLLTQSRVFRTEGLTAGLMVLSILPLLLYVKTRQKRWLVTSSVLAGLAILTKMTSLYLFAFTALTLCAWPFLIDRLRLGMLLKQAGSDFVVWSLMTSGTFFALWPALWVAPITTFRFIADYLQRAATNVGATWGEGGYFFFQGKIMMDDPGVSFYLWALAYRTTPMLWLGLSIFFIVAIRWFVTHGARLPQVWPPRSVVTGLILIYVISYFGAMSLGASKVDRYLLPIIPGLSILAAVGLGQIADFFPASKQVVIKWGLGVALLAASVGLAWFYHPYYFDYWNPLLGGGRQAATILPVGSGEGVDTLLSFLNSQPNAPELNLTGSGTIVVQTCSFVFSGHCLEETDFLASDYFMTYIFDLQRRTTYLSRVQTVLTEAELIQTYTKDGVDYARLYKMPNHMHGTSQWLGAYGRLRGYRFSAVEVGAGDPWTATIYWENNEKQGWQLEDSEFFVKLLDERGQVYQTISAQLDPQFQSYLSQPGEILRFVAPLTLPPDMPLGRYTVALGLRLKANGEETWNFSLPVSASTITVNRGAIGSSTERVQAPHRLGHPLDNIGLTLLGYDLTTQPAPRLDLYWQAERPLAENYRLNVALLNRREQVVIAWNNLLSPEIHPLTTWQPGEVVRLSWFLEAGFTLPPDIDHLNLSLQSLKGAEPGLAAINLPQLPANFTLLKPEVNPQHHLESVTFGPQLDLLGYDLTGKGGGAAGVLFLNLYWLNRAPLEPLEGQVEVLTQDGKIITQQTLPVPSPSPSHPLTWQSVSHYELSLNDIPAALTVQVRPSGTKKWYNVQISGQPVGDQMIIEDVLNKILMTAN